MLKYVGTTLPAYVAQVRGTGKAAGELYCPLDVTNTYTSTFYN
jgi:hypothetical protein